MMCCNKSKMDGYLFLVLLYFIGVAICRSQEASYTYMVQSRTTWTSAVQSCSKKGGSLLTDTEIEVYFLNKMSLTHLQFEDDCQKLGSQEFWIKEYNYKSPWISAKGCFSDITMTTSADASSEINTVGTCHQKCSHFEFFATQKKSCECLSEREFQKLTEVNGAKCNLPCSGDMYDRCGGAGVYNIYQTTDIHPSPETSCQQSQDCDCIGLRCNKSTIVYFSDVCRKTYKSTCNVGERSYIGPPADWATSFYRCVSLGGSYDIKTLEQNPATSVCWNGLWIGMFRLNLVLKGPINCPYCRVGRINWTDLSCYMKDCQSYRTSICRYGEDNPSTSREFTKTVAFGILIGVLIGSSFCALLAPIVVLLKRKISRQTVRNSTVESGHVYFTAPGGARTSTVYEDLDQNNYIEPMY